MDLLKILNNYHSVALGMLTRTNRGNHANISTINGNAKKKSHKDIIKRKIFRESTERHTFG